MMPFIAGVKTINIRIMIKFNTITSIEGVEPLNKAAKTIEKTTIYTIAIEAIVTTYENIRSQIDDILRVLYLKIV